mgnify:CR=1 FL=1
MGIKRVSRYGMVGFFRNGFVSLSAILIMTITLFVIASLVVGGAALQSTLKGLTEKVDINVYFLAEATEEQILDLKKSIETLPEVATVQYVSRGDVLTRFQDRHKNNSLMLQGIDELGQNPFGASLAIQAKETSQYESIAKFLDSTPAAGAEGSARIIEDVNFGKNRETIDRLTNIIATLRKLSMAIAIFFGIASILIAFNTIRLVIYTSKDEIGVMRLVGAERWYVRGPFMITGVLYGLTAGTLVLLVLYPLSYWLAADSEKFLIYFNTLTYFTSHFAYIFLVVMGTGVLLGAISSFLAVRRYLTH